MGIRRLVRGELSQSRLEAVASEVAGLYGKAPRTVEVLDADNWLSTPAVVNDRWFVKVITRQNSLVHAVLTTGRNLGVFSSGSRGFFQHFATPIEMARHELTVTRGMRELGVNAPAPLAAFDHEGNGVLVFEYLPSFQTLDELDPEHVEAIVPQLFDALARVHGAGLAHGDIRSENVLVVDGDLYFIDATSVREDAADEARAYDLACALAALEPLAG